MQASGIAIVAPASFEELYREHYDYVQTLVRKFGIDSNNVDDVTSIIMLKLFEKKLVEQFNGELISTYTGKPVVFKSFLYGFVSKYVMHHRDRQEIMKRRNVHFMDDTEDMNDWTMAGQQGRVYGSAYLGVHNDNHDELYRDEMVSRIRTACLAQPKRTAKAHDLATFFDFVLMQIEDTGTINRAELADLFEMSQSGVSKWLYRLRDVVSELLATES